MSDGKKKYGIQTYCYTDTRAEDKATHSILGRWIGWKVVMYNTNNNIIMKKVVVVVVAILSLYCLYSSLSPSSSS
jgi:hypothetical protein